MLCKVVNRISSKGRFLTSLTMSGLSFVPENKYSKVPEKAPGRLYMVGEVGKMRFVDRANQDGWYTRFDAATGEFTQLDGKFSDYTEKFPYAASSSATSRSGAPAIGSSRAAMDSGRAAMDSSRVTGRSKKQSYDEDENSKEESTSRRGGLDLSSLQYASPRDEDAYSDRPSVRNMRTMAELAELTGKKNALSKKLKSIDAAIEADKQKYIPNYQMSPCGLMAARKSPAVKHVMRSTRKKTFYRTPGGQVIYYPGIFILDLLYYWYPMVNFIIRNKLIFLILFFDELHYFSII